mgnify:CR=1 FL=1
MAKRAYVVTTIDMMVKNVRMAITSEAKLKRADKLLNFVWDNRIIIRKNGRACRMLHKKTGLIILSNVNVSFINGLELSSEGIIVDISYIIPGTSSQIVT